jgi:hypothetical protein
VARGSQTDRQAGRRAGRQAGGRATRGIWILDWQLHVVFVGPAWGYGEVACLHHQQDQICPCGFVSDAPFTAHLAHTSKQSVGYIGQLAVVDLCTANVLILHHGSTAPAHQY